MARVLWPVRSMATRSGTLARIRARAGRVRAPAGRRLCVLLQIGDELVPGLEQFLFVDDVVRLMSASLGPFGPGCCGHSLDENSRRYVRRTNA